MKAICEANELVLVLKEPTPEIMAAAALATMQAVSSNDFELARKAALLVAVKTKLASSVSLDELVALIAAMAPAYRAMVAAACTARSSTKPGNGKG